MKISAKDVIIPAKDVFCCDYTNLKEVIALCKRFGPGNVVVRSENNFNITKECRINGREVMYRPNDDSA